jgi:hypothetical protein
MWEYQCRISALPLSFHLRRAKAMSASEVATLRQRIEQEAIAMHRLLSEPALVSRHAVINQKSKILGVYHQQLAQFIGKEQAGAVLVQAYAKATETDDTP